MRLQIPSKKIINHLNINSKDSVLIITDKKRERIANSLFKEASKITKTLLIKIPIAKHSGMEPPLKVAELMKKYTHTIAPTTSSISHFF